MKTRQTLAFCLIILGCTACGSDPAKPSASQKRLTTKTTMTTANAFHKMAYEQGVLIALQMSPNMTTTNVLASRPCKITTHRFAGTVEQPQDKQLAYTHEIKYNAQNRVSEITRVSPRSTITYTFDYKNDRLIKTTRVSKRPDGATSTAMTTYAYNDKGELVTSEVSRKGETKYKLAFAFDEANKAVNATTTAVKTNKIVDGKITFDDQWRVTNNLGTTYEHSADKITGKGKNTEYNIILKDGLLQSFKSTYILRGETERRFTALLTATYEDKKLAQIISTPVPKTEMSKITMRDFDYTCGK